MSDEVRAKIEKLQADYQEVVGRPFNHFYCPILFQDKDVCLCKAHIVNQAFHNSSKAWTVQRKDVDSFFGSNFEADFVALQYARTRSPAEIFAQKDLHKKFDPKIVMDGKQVDYFIATGQIPKQFTAIEFEQEGRPVLKIGLKISPKAVVASVNSKWALDISKDMRIAAMVSLIKSAHLTLFEMLGYRYALSSGGEFVGRQILGEFFRQNHGKRKSAVLQNAGLFFREFVNMVRPVLSYGFNFQGTISDRMVLICWGSSGFAWAVIVFMRTGQLLHAVMLPVCDRVEMVTTFLDFLRNENASIDVSLCRYERIDGHWNTNREPTRLTWPKTGILYP